MTTNIDWLTARPIAHRGLHNSDEKIYENTLSAYSRAIEGGFNIEVDMHPAADNVPVLFHDLTLERMAANNSNVRDLTSGQLGNIQIGAGNDQIATLDQLLDLTDGKVGLVLEMKGRVGDDEGFVEAIAKCLKSYRGPVVIMSFGHWLLKDARRLAPDLPLGLVAKGDDRQYQSHKMIAEQCDIDFVSYNHKDLPCKFATEFRNCGKPLISWTIKSPQQQRHARQNSDQITFEGFDPDRV